MKRRLIVPFSLMFLAGVSAAPAAVTMVDCTLPADFTIPDDSSVGVADFHDLTSEVTSIESVEVSVVISGGFNGDYYMYLQHEGGGFSVLMNRVGKTEENPFGHADEGVSVTFLTSAPKGDIHHYQTVIDPDGSTLTGVWAPDGRTNDPLDVRDTDERPASLDSFVGADANGQWTLFVADRNSGQIGTLVSWSLKITGAVPEPGTTAPLILCGLVGFLRRRRR